MNIRLFILSISLSLLVGCELEMPDTSSITINMEALSTPVNKNLYGLTIEEINHSIDGGIYAELIQNRSFEDGVIPLNCRYNPASNQLITPNGWAMPFLKPGSIPGWHSLSPDTYISINEVERINEKNRRSLQVYIPTSEQAGKKGIAAEGYNGIPIRKGERYDLSLYIKGASIRPRTLSISLEDSLATSKMSDELRINTKNEWMRITHTFTATSDTDNALLTIVSDTSSMFWIDMVSLLPVKRWRNSSLRLDLIEKIASLNPSFIRFPGGRFVEGYMVGTYPIWYETIGNIDERKSFWNIRSYGSTNGVGYHELLQLCEDLKAQPIYVVNSGITNQKSRPRYEEMKTMGKLIQEALTAIAYANQPKDSIFGVMRSKNGHPEPFNLRYIEIGSENYGQEYNKRFKLFKEAINRIYPDIIVISSGSLDNERSKYWEDTHYYGTRGFFLTSHKRYDRSIYEKKKSIPFIGEFSLSGNIQGTLEDAIAEACFMIGVERGQNSVTRLGYAPILGNADYPLQQYPAILFDRSRVTESPSYYLLDMFYNNRGDLLLQTDVETYERPQVTSGRVAIETFDNSYEIKKATINNEPVTGGDVINGGWDINDGTMIPKANKWNLILLGDSSLYDYTFSTDIRRTKGSGSIEFRFRNQTKPHGQSDYIGLTLGNGTCALYKQSGEVRDTLCKPAEYNLSNNVAYTMRLSCEKELIKCYINDTLIQEARLAPIPSIVSVATLDKQTNTILLKVVNTTRHEEKTRLNIKGASIKYNAEAIQLTGHPESGNTFDNPDKIVPEKREVSFSLNGPLVYKFPPCSITILKLPVD